MTDIHASPEPADRLGHIAAEMLEVLDKTDDVKGMVMLSGATGRNRPGMLAMSGYDDGAEAIADLYEQFKVLCSHHGLSAVLIPMQQGQN